jgi:hypothetical protein
MNRKMLVEVITEQLSMGKTTVEIAQSAASVLATTSKASWWLGDFPFTFHLNH